MIRHIAGLIVAGLLVFAPNTAIAAEMKAKIMITGGGVYDYVVIGMKADASDGFDNSYDSFSPSANLNDTYIHAYFPHPQWNAVKSEFRADIRQVRQYQHWNLSVYTNLPEATPVEISLLADESTLPPSCYLGVSDSIGGHPIEMKRAAFGFTVSPNEPTAHFNIILKCR